MARYEYVLIGTDDAYVEVVQKIAAALGLQPTDGDSGPVWQINDTTGMVLSTDDLYSQDAPELGIVDVRYELELGAVNPADQTAAARTVYDLILAATDWKVVLTTDDGQTVVATRPARSAAA